MTALVWGAALGIGWALAHPAVTLIFAGCCAAFGAIALALRWDARRDDRRATRDVPPPGGLRYRYGTALDPGPAPFEVELGLPPWAIQDSDHKDPPAGGEDPGDGGLPEGDTQLLWPVQETAAPGDLLAKATAAIDALQSIPVDDYLTEVEAATTWEDRVPLASFLSADTITRAGELPAFKDEVTP